MKKILSLLLFTYLYQYVPAQVISNEPYRFLGGYFWEAEPGKPEVVKHKISSMEVTEYRIKNKKAVEPQIVHQLWFGRDALPTEAIFYEDDSDFEGGYRKKYHITFLYTPEGYIRQALETEHRRKDSTRSELHYFYASDGKASQLIYRTNDTYFDEEKHTVKELGWMLSQLSFVYRNDTVQKITRSRQTDREDIPVRYDTLYPNIPFDSLFVLPRDTISKITVDSLGRQVEVHQYAPDYSIHGVSYGPYHLTYIIRYTYDERNLVTGQKIYSDKDKLLTTREYIYNEKGLLSESRHNVYGKESLVRYTYTYYTD